MPYCLELRGVPEGALERLIELGALDVDASPDGRVRALMPDAVLPGVAARVARAEDYSVSAAVSRDAGSVWVLRPGPLQIGPLRIVPPEMDQAPGALRLIDAPAFGTGYHPTTALCLDALAQLVASTPPERMLDVGTGSGILALGALMMGVSDALALEIDDEAVRVAVTNARLNGMSERLHIVRGGPEAVTGTWPLVIANVLAAPLIEMAPTLVRRLGHDGRLVLSGIPVGLADEVARAYVHLGLRSVESRTRAGWVVIVLATSW
jgi:ribosomal protein L11 methyltransferase